MIFDGGLNGERTKLIAEAYSAFNQRNIDGVLALMSESVNWPRASEGGRAIGKEEIRAYWTRQWKEIDPHVEPMEVIDRGAGKIDVRVHQLVKSLEWRCAFRQRGLALLYHRRRPDRTDGPRKKRSRLCANPIVNVLP